MMNLVYLLFVSVLWNERTVLSNEELPVVEHNKSSISFKYEDSQLFDVVDKNALHITHTKFSGTDKKFQGICPENQLFYPDEDGGDQGECDCEPGFLFDPKTDSCHRFYDRASCGENQSLILEFNSSSPTCVPNPCGWPRFPYDKLCVSLTTRTDVFLSCAPLRDHRLLMNYTTLTVGCLDEYELQLEFNSYHKFCWKGGKRWFKDRCKGKNTKPFDLPGCPEGELYYPGDKPGEWKCDCKPGYIYHSSSDSCFAAYTQGPCAHGQHFVFPLGRVSPICIRNRCPSVDKVFFRDACYEFRAFEPCSPEFKVFGVNLTTFQLECSPLKLLLN